MAKTSLRPWVCPTGFGFNRPGTEARTGAATGEFVLQFDQVDPVVETLRSGGLEIEAIHNHRIHDEPRLFYVHFWAVDNAETLARNPHSAEQSSDEKKD